MYQTEGSFMTVATGAVVRKKTGNNNGSDYAYLTLVRKEVHKDVEYKHYLKVNVSGFAAKHVHNNINLGDSVIVEGQMVTVYKDVVGDPNGRKEAENVLRANTVQSHRLPSQATRNRIEASRAQQQPQQPVPASAQHQTPQQQPQYAPQQPQQQQQYRQAAPQPQPQYNEPPMDFDDDIPF